MDRVPIRCRKNLEPYNNLWQTTSDWIHYQEVWLRGPFLDLDAEACEAAVDNILATITKAAEPGSTTAV